MEWMMKSIADIFTRDTYFEFRNQNPKNDKVEIEIEKT